MRLLERGLPVRKPPLCHELGVQDARAPLEERAFLRIFTQTRLSNLTAQIYTNRICLLRWPNVVRSEVYPEKITCVGNLAKKCITDRQRRI